MKSRGFPLQYFFLRTPFVNDVSKFFVDGFRGQLSRGEGITQFVIVAVGAMDYLAFLYLTERASPAGLTVLLQFNIF